MAEMEGEGDREGLREPVALPLAVRGGEGEVVAWKKEGEGVTVAEAHWEGEMVGV